MDARTMQVDDLRLVALPSALGCAEMFVRFALTEWSLRPLIPEATHVIREIVTGTIRGADPAAPRFITARLRLDGNNCLVVEIEDERPLAPGRVPASLAGRPAGVVSLHGGGMVTWCEIPLPAGQTASSVPLPRRERRKPPTSAGPVDDGDIAEMDPQVIERILTRLNRSAE